MSACGLIWGRTGEGMWSHPGPDWGRDVVSSGAGLGKGCTLIWGQTGEGMWSHLGPDMWSHLGLDWGKVCCPARGCCNSQFLEGRLTKGSVSCWLSAPGPLAFSKCWLTPWQLLFKVSEQEGPLASRALQSMECHPESDTTTSVFCCLEVIARPTLTQQ